MYILAKYGMIDCKPILVPLDENDKLNVGDVLDNVTMSKKIVGSLIYMTITRPNTIGVKILENHIWMVYIGDYPKQQAECPCR